MAKDRLDLIAIMIAIHPPVRQPESTNAYIPWRLILSLREELDARGVDWRKVKASHGGAK